MVVDEVDDPSIDSVSTVSVEADVVEVVDVSTDVATYSVLVGPEVVDSLCIWTFYSQHHKPLVHGHTNGLHAPNHK